MQNNKPTPEELKAQQQAAIDAAEEQEKNPPKEGEGEKQAEPSTVIPVENESKEEPKEGEEESKEEEPQADPSEEAKERLKNKLSASARENQKIYAKNRVMNQALTEADEIPEPTDEEMQSIYKEDWDVMSEIDRDLAKETIISKKWRAKIQEASQQAKKIENWNDSVSEFIDDPKTLIDNPELEGKADDFKTFATNEANNSVPFKILVSAFLHDQATNKPSNKGGMFERASGGPNDRPAPRDGKITIEEARQLRETDYAKWKEYLMAGKIKQDF